jgi:hypothetical protein
MYAIQSAMSSKKIGLDKSRTSAHDAPMKAKTVNGYTIEKGIPLPRGGKGGSGRKYPWRDMEIGESVLISCDDGETPAKVVARLGASLAYAAPRKFTRRREKRGVRVWRIA